MTTTEFATLVRYKTKTNSTTFTDAQILLLMNIFKNEIASKIVERNADYFLTSETFNLVASSTTRIYSFNANILARMHKLEIKFSSTDSRFPSKYIKNYSGSETESEIVKNYTNSEGGFAHTIRGKGIFILSGTITAVTDGGQIFYYLYPADFAALNGSTDMAVDPSASTFGFPRQFHELLARRVSIEWKGAQPKPVPLNRHELNFEYDLQLALDSIAHRDESGDIIGDSLSAAETGNNGFDY